MRLIRWLNLSAVVACLMVLAIAFVLVPDKTWNAATTTSVTLFAFSVAFVFYLPLVALKDSNGSNAAHMASLGPLCFVTGGLLLLTAAGFVSALIGWDNIAWVMDIFAFGLFLISQFMLRAALEVVGNVASQYAGPSKHTVWQSEVHGLRAVAADPTTKSGLERLAEKLRFAASDIPGGSPQDYQVSSEIQTLADLLGSDSSAILQKNISKIEMLVAQRDVFLRSSRNKV